MTVLLAHPCDGTVGTSATAAGEGFTSLHGVSPVYASNGFSGQCLTFTGGASNFAQDNNAAQYGAVYVKYNALPGVASCFARTVISGGAATATILLNANGTLSIMSSLTTTVATSTAALVAGSWARLEWNVGASTQELRIFLDPTSATSSEVLTGACTAAPFAWYWGFSWAANTAGPVNLDQITLCDSWPNLGVVTPPPAITHQMLIGGVLTPMTERALINGVLTNATDTIFTSGTPAGGTNVLPFTLPATI